jgi:hypothetical protein
MYGWSAIRLRTTLHAWLADLLKRIRRADLKALIHTGKKVWLAGNEVRGRRVCLNVTSEIETGFTRRARPDSSTTAVDAAALTTFSSPSSGSD